MNKDFKQIETTNLFLSIELEYRPATISNPSEMAGCVFWEEKIFFILLYEVITCNHLTDKHALQGFLQFFNFAVFTNNIKPLKLRFKSSSFLLI